MLSTARDDTRDALAQSFQLIVGSASLPLRGHAQRVVFGLTSWIGPDVAFCWSTLGLALGRVAVPLVPWPADEFLVSLGPLGLLVVYNLIDKGRPAASARTSATMLGREAAEVLNAAAAGWGAAPARRSDKEEASGRAAAAAETPGRRALSERYIPGKEMALGEPRQSVERYNAE